MTYKEKKCPCGKMFTPSHPREKYCDDNCRKTYEKKLNAERVKRYQEKNKK